MQNKERGFTLLELLVVISIIGILIGLIAVGLTRSQQRGRDSRRQADVKAIQQAFEQYHLDNNEYDTSNIEGMAAGYLSAGIPTDPKPDHDPYSFSTYGTDGYCICATLETGNGNSSANDCSGLGPVASGNDYYCVASLYY